MKTISCKFCCIWFFIFEVISFSHCFSEDLKAECGKDGESDRIYGGTATAINEFPWLAVLFYQSEKSYPLCGGALVTSRFVITAAHCVAEKYTKKVGEIEAVCLGEYDLASEQDCTISHGIKNCADLPVNYTPEQIFSHPKYSSKDWHKNDDLALIKLKETVTYSDYILPICMPYIYDINSLNLNPSIKIVAAGWGRTEHEIEDPSNITTIKQKVTLPVFDYDKCSEVYNSLKKIKIGPNRFCAGGEDNKNTCRGDSGSAIMHFSFELKRWFLYGITSAGLSNCGTAGFPTLFTDISKYSDWLNEIIVKNS